MAYKIKSKRKKEKELSYNVKHSKLKKIEWINGNKMKFESPFKIFNKQTNIISTGNAYANTQTSSFIRPYSEEINPVGEKREKGYLQNWDLNNFNNLPYNVKEDVIEKGKDKSLILYEFHHYNNERKIVDGYVLTDTNYKHIKTYYTNPNYKSEGAVNEASKYISWGEK